MDVISSTHYTYNAHLDLEGGFRGGKTGTLGTANVSRTTINLNHPTSCPTRHGGCEVVMNKVQR